MSKENKMTEEELQRLERERDLRKSKVRIMVTYMATAFLFGGGSVFISFLIWTGQRDSAFNLFMTLLPVGASIISFWFAGRNQNK